MTNPRTETDVPTPSDAVRQAWLAQTRQQLLGPCDALQLRVRRLIDSLPPETPRPFADAVNNMLIRSQNLLELIRTRLESSLLYERSDDAERKLRHDLRGHAAFILSACDLWRRKIGKLLDSRFQPEIEQIRDAASHIVTLIEKLVSFSADNAASAAGDIRDLYELFKQLPVSNERGDILLVDDDRFQREIVGEMLRTQGHQVTEAESGREAFDLLSQRPVDAILLDVMMPEMNGIEVLERLKKDEFLKNLPVIMISSLDMVDTAVGCISRGAEDYLSRPVNELLLQARVGASLEKKRLRDREAVQSRRIDELLHAIFPPELVDELKETSTIQSRRFEHVGVLFLDIVGFTNYCEQRRDHPEEVVARLGDQILAFEEAARKHGVQKIKTIGDAFMATAGLLRECPNPVLKLVRCGLDLIEAARRSPVGWQIRVGIHVGPVVAGMLGKSQFSFDLWGATVNTAARMESNGRPGGITLSSEAWLEIAELAQGSVRDTAVRGIGPMQVWDFERFLDAPK